MKRAAALPALMLALVVGLLPAGQCATRLILNYCCCDVPAAEGQKHSACCCAKHASTKDPVRLSHAPSAGAGAEFCTYTVSENLRESVQQPLVIASAEPSADSPVRASVSDVAVADSALQARPPDTPIFIAIQSLLI